MGRQSIGEAASAKYILTFIVEGGPRLESLRRRVDPLERS